MASAAATTILVRHLAQNTTRPLRLAVPDTPLFVTC
jgi:hypothetical protein